MNQSMKAFLIRCGEASLLLLGIALHLRFLWTMPDPIFHWDSESYLRPVVTFLYSGQWIITSDRTLGYPAFLLAILRFLPHFSAVLWIQHLIWLLCALVAGLIFRTFFSKSRTGFVIVFFLVTVLPRGIVYSHSIMTEVLFTPIAWASVLLFLIARQNQRISMSSAAGFAMGVALLVRPTAQAWVLAIFLVSIIPGVRLPGRARIFAVFVLGLLVVLAPVSTYNYLHQGYFGTTNMTGHALYGGLAPFLDADRVEDSRIRNILLPFSTPHWTESMKSPGWVRFAPEGPVTAIAKIIPNETQRDRLLLNLGLAAAREHPFRILWDQGGQFARFFILSCRHPTLFLSKEDLTFFGFTFFKHILNLYPQAGELVSIPVSDSRLYFRWMQTHPSYPFEPGPFPLSLVWPLVWAVQLLPLLALISIVAHCLMRVRRFEMVTLGLIILFHIVISDVGGGDLQVRYVVPLEPIYVVLAIAGLSLLIKTKRGVPSET
jgi:4-amino-4-deoxy-L-arabinose transferase-like glycosyltransferase